MRNFDEKEISGTIGGEEQISRFVRHENYIRNNQTLRHEALGDRLSKKWFAN